MIHALGFFDVGRGICGSIECDPGQTQKMTWASSEEDPGRVRKWVLGKEESSSMVHMLWCQQMPRHDNACEAYLNFTSALLYTIYPWIE